MIVIDSLRYDHVNAHGYLHETTPNLNQLISESVSFDNAFAASNYTVLSVPAYFTGKPPSHFHDPHPPKFSIPSEEQTLAETLSEAGFDTFLWSSNLHLKTQGFPQGFTNRFTSYLQTRGIISIEGLIREIDVSYHPTGAPEFHYIHTMDVHFPYRPPHPFEDQFSSITHPYGGPVVQDGLPYDDLGAELKSNFPYYSETHDMELYDIRHLVRLYDATIRYTDFYLPQLLESLDYDPDNDLLILTADHGEQFYSHGWWGHQRLLLTQETHVPLIVKHPNFQAKRISNSVSLMDLYP